MLTNVPNAEKDLPRSMELVFITAEEDASNAIQEIVPIAMNVMKDLLWRMEIVENV